MHYQNKSKSSFFGGEKRLFYALAILLLMFATNLGCDSASKKPSKAPSNGGKAGESPRTQTPPAKDSGKGSEDDDAEEDDGEDDDDKDKDDEDKDEGDDDDKDENGDVSSVKDFQKKYSLASKGAVLVICGMRDADFRRIASYADRGRDRSLENLLSLRIRAARVDISDKDIDGIIKTATDVSDSSSKRDSLKKDCQEIVEKA